MTEKNSGSKIPEHPILRKLIDAGATGVTSLRGYVGPSEKKGYIRLYASLDDLTQSVEIAEADILHYEDTPETVLPNKAVTVWVKKGTEVTQKVDRVRTSEAARDVLTHGRLEVRLPSGGDDLRSVCQSVCGVCQSVCGVCQSRPLASPVVRGGLKRTE